MTLSRRIFGLVVLCLVSGGSQHVNAAAARMARSTENEELQPVTTTARAEIVFIVTPEQTELTVTSPGPIRRELDESTTLSGPMERDLEEAVTLQGLIEFGDSTTTGPMERELEDAVTLPGPIERDLEESTTFEPALAQADVEQDAAITTMPSLQESRAAQEEHVSTTVMPACDEQKTASIAVHEETTEKTSTTMKHPMKLLEFLKDSSKPRSRTFTSESHAVKPKNKKTKKTEFGAKVMSSQDPVVVAGKTSRGARFFSSASSLLLGLMPAVSPPSVRGGRAACAGPCHVNPMEDLATLAAEMVQVQVSNASRRFPSRRVRPQATKSVTSTTTTTEAPVTTSTIRVPLSRFSARRRIEPSTTTTTAAPVEEQVVTTTTPEPDVTTTRNPRMFMFRKFKILQRSSTPHTSVEN